MAKINVMGKVTGRSAQAVELDASSTVGELKDRLDLDEKYTATVDGAQVGDDHRLGDGAYVTFAENIKGGQA